MSSWFGWGGAETDEAAAPDAEAGNGQAAESKEVTTAAIGAAFSEGFRKDGGGQLPGSEPPSPAVSTSNVPPIRAGTRRRPSMGDDDDRPSARSGGSSTRGSTRVDAAEPVKRPATRSRRPRWENEDSDEEAQAQAAGASDTGQTDAPVQLAVNGRYPWEAEPVQTIPEEDEVLAVSLEDAEEAMRPRRPSVPVHWPFLSEAGTREEKRRERDEADNPEALVAINEYSEDVAPLRSYEQSVLQVGPAQVGKQGKAGNASEALSAGVPAFLTLAPEQRNQEVADGKDWQNAKDGAQRDDDEDDDDDEVGGDGEGGKGEDDDGDNEAEKTKYAKKNAIRDEIKNCAATLEQEQQLIEDHDRQRKLDDISTRRASRVIQEVVKMKKVYVDQRMKLFQDSQKMGREVKLRERKIMSWIALLGVLNKFDQLLKDDEIKKEMNRTYLMSLPPPPPPPPRGRAPGPEDEDLHEQYERMRLRFAPAWEKEGRTLLGEAQFQQIRNMTSGPAEKQKKLIAEKCFDEAMTVMSEKEHIELLRQAWRLENNWEPQDQCDPLSFAQEKMNKMEAEKAAQLKEKRNQAKRDQLTAGKK